MLLHHHVAVRHRRRPTLVCAAVRTSPSQSPALVTSNASTTTSRAGAVNVSDTQIASMTAGILSRILLHPVDCIKTRLQHFRAHSSSKEPVQALMRFIAKERLAGLYRGIIGATLGVIPFSMLYMPSYEMAQLQLSTYLGSKELFGFRHVLAGSFAGLCGSLVKVPVDVVKKRVQAGIYPNVLAAILAIMNEGGTKYSQNALLNFGNRAAGVKYFYAGWRSSILYDIPYNSVQFLILENVKRTVSSLKGEGKQLSRSDNVIVGALTGMITSLITEPLDVVKTRMMTQKSQALSQQGMQIYRGWLHCMTTMVKEEGVLSLWKGTLPRLVWVGASSAIWYGTYQAVKQSISSKRVQNTRRRNELVQHSDTGTPQR